MSIELGLHHDGPNVDSHIQNNDGIQAELGTSTLVEALHIKDEAETETADTEKNDG